MKIKLLSISAILIGIVLLLTLLLILPLRWLNPLTTSFILRDDVESVWVYQRWVAGQDIPPAVFMSILAAEDQRFPTHHGIDITELKKALSQAGGPQRGASTITQQLVKNLYLWPSKSMPRKALEAYLALSMEVLLPKTRILELYVNAVEFGEGIYGIGQASNHLFGKPAVQLNRIDASLLAAVLPNPKKMRANKPSPYVYQRAQEIRLSIRRLGGNSYLELLD